MHGHAHGGGGELCTATGSASVSLPQAGAVIQRERCVALSPNALEIEVWVGGVDGFVCSRGSLSHLIYMWRAAGVSCYILPLRVIYMWRAGVTAVSKAKYTIQL